MRGGCQGWEKTAPSLLSLSIGELTAAKRPLGIWGSALQIVAARLDLALASRLCDGSGMSPSLLWPHQWPRTAYSRVPDTGAGRRNSIRRKGPAG